MSDFTERVKVFYDAEFTGLHRNTSLISIGLVSESGAYFYAEFNDYDDKQVTDWIRDNVIAGLLYNDQSYYHWIGEFWDGPKGHPMGTGAHRYMNIMVKDTREKIAQNLLFWLQWEYEAYDHKKIQFFTDCYAYDWVVLNDLICEGGDALKLPEIIDYIPIDLSTALYMGGTDPDITREEYAGEFLCQKAQQANPFKNFGGALKHNCLWDAYVAMLCWDRVFNPNRNRRVYSPEVIESVFNKDLHNKIENKLKSMGQSLVGEIEHPAAQSILGGIDQPVN